MSDLLASLHAAGESGEALRVLGRVRAGEHPLAWSAQGGRLTVDVQNGLVEVDGAVPLPRLASFCREHGLRFPFARPVPSLRFAAACAAIPILVEGFVSSLEAATLGGQRIVTPRAPRSAQGPDGAGAVLGAAPLALCLSARVRTLDVARSRAQAFHLDDASQAAAFIIARMREGRAYSLDVSRRDGGFEAIVVEGISSGMRRRREPGQHDEPSVSGADFRPRSGRMLQPLDEPAIGAALDGGARVIAAPFMHRVGTLEPAPAAVRLGPVDEAASDLAQAMGVDPHLPEPR